MYEKLKLAVIDVKNQQNSYSAVDVLIRMAEEDEKCDDVMCFDKIQVRIGNLPDTYINSISNKKTKTDLVKNVEDFLAFSKNDNRLRLINNANELKNELKDNVKLVYYIRINNEKDEDIVSLQYLILILQGLINIHDRIICFIVPSVDYYCKNVHSDEETSKYYKFSHYLRFVSYKLFWGAFFKKLKNSNNFEIVHASLTDKPAGIQKTFLPLLEINKDTYQLLSATIGDKVVGKNNISECISIADEIAKRKNILSTAIDMVKKQEISVLQYLLLCTILPESKSKKDAVNLVELYIIIAAELSDGIFQLLENIIRYSQLHKGVFSFRIHGKDSEFISSEVGWNNDNRTVDESEIMSFLEVGIADYNIKENMLDNFFAKSTIQAEDILKFREKVGVKDLFREYDEDEEINNAWKVYHKNNRLSGMGLPRMKENVEGNTGFLFAKSSTTHRIDNDRFGFVKDYFKCVNANYKNYNGAGFIPGTQYRIIFPIPLKEEKNMVYNSDIFAPIIGNLKEDEEAFAECFDYNAELFKLDIALRDFEIKLTDAYYGDYLSGKDECVRLWTELFNSSFIKKDISDNKIIYCFDALDVSNTGRYWLIETFCKGLIGSLLLSANGVKSFAIINCSRLFMTMFIRTYYFIGDNENNTHIYLSGKNVEDELYIVGHNREQIEKNIIQYAFPRRRLDFMNYTSDKTQVGADEYYNVIPFDVIISRQGIYSSEENRRMDKTIFDEYIEKIGGQELTDKNGAGYKISDTHMRLGSKVHLDSFYEIAILFQKPRIARRIAYKVLRQLYEDYYKKSGDNIQENNRIWNERILFYGYSSYTRLILESLIELAKKVSKNESLDWAFAIYQNDIVVEKRNNCVSPIDSIIYSNSKLKDNKTLEDYSIVQIVPISTSLTTFKKMKGKMEEVLSAGGGYRSIENRIRANYTFFWVRNVNDIRGSNENQATELESSFWTKIEDDNSINTKLISPRPYFFSSVRSQWHDPLICDKCYPNILLDERVLTETDVTSTIPSVQLERSRIINNSNAGGGEINDSSVDNEERILKLKSSLRYGHIYRENNHFQYYFDTNELYLSQKTEIEKWLSGIEKKDNVLNIIVTPLHHTNAGFCQCVNNAVFNGTADIISFDAAREYKSNVEAKYADVKETILRARELNIQTRFIFVDDTIISGTAFRRINNLIHVLVNEKDRKPIQIDEVFVLINRMSESSQNNYVSNPNDSFHAFVNLNISSVRNHGTSCIMCGMRRDAESFFRRSSTKSMSEYWNSKLYDYQEKSFDDCDEGAEKEIDGYYRMLCSHVAGDIYKYSSENKQIFSNIIDFFENLTRRTPSTPIYRELRKKKAVAIRSYLKVLVRPFFSFGKSYRQCIHDFFLFITESFLNPNFVNSLLKSDEGSVSISGTKPYLNDKAIQTRLLNVYKLMKKEFKDDLGTFVIDYLIEGLADIRSNYVMRKETLINICRFFGQLQLDSKKIDILFEKIRINIHRLINVSSDETKTLWLEYLLATWNEYPKDKKSFYKYIRRADYSRDLPIDIDKNVCLAFKSFAEDLYIDNIRLYYDGTKHILDRMTDDEKRKGDVERVIDLLREDYYFVNYKNLINLHYNVMHYEGTSLQNKELDEKELLRQIKILVNFLLCLNRARKEGQENLPNIQARYNNLYEVLKKLVWPDENDEDTRILDIVVESESGQLNETEYYSLEENKTVIPHMIRLDIEKAKLNKHFIKSGYYISEKLNYVVIAIQNNYEHIAEKYKESAIRESRIAPVYIYAKTTSPEEKYVLLEIVRRVLMFKHQLLHLFEQDFSNNSIDDLMKNKIRNEQLARDNAGDHSKASDLTSIMRILQTVPTKEDTNNIGYWFLLRTYVNMRIGRLFRRLMNNDKSNSIIYVDKNSNYSNNSNIERDFWYLPLINLGDSILENISNNYVDLIDGKELDISPKYYFYRLNNAFIINFHADGKREEGITFDRLFELFRAFDCVEGDKGFYRSEFIICILLDILFSSINNSKEWKSLISNPANEWLMMDQFLLLSNERCVVEIGVERTDLDIDYLTIENEKKLREDETVEDVKRVLNDLENGGNPTKGLSLWTIKQYIEGIWDDCPLKVVYQFSEGNHKNSFKTCLPIIQRKGNKWKN